jgi:hypothetical protein
VQRNGPFALQSRCSSFRRRFDFGPLEAATVLQSLVRMAGAAGIEPATYGFGVPCSVVTPSAEFSNRVRFGFGGINALRADFQGRSVTIVSGRPCRCMDFCRSVCAFLRSPVLVAKPLVGGKTLSQNADITAQVFHRQVVPRASGAYSGDIGALIQQIEGREHRYPGRYRARALDGLDTALRDLAGRRAVKPMTSLIAGAAGPMRAYASSMQARHRVQGQSRKICPPLRRKGVLGGNTADRGGAGGRQG